MDIKKRNPVARNCPKKGGAHTDKKKESKRRPKRIPLPFSPLEWECI